MGTQTASSAGAVVSLKSHLVWGPTYRRPVLVGAVAARLTSLLAEKAGQSNAILHVLSVMPDHVALLVETPPPCSPARLAGWLNGDTSRALRSECGPLRDRPPALWSRSDSIGTVGHVAESTVRRSIEAQRGG